MGASGTEQELTQGQPECRGKTGAEEQLEALRPSRVEGALEAGVPEPSPAERLEFQQGRRQTGTPSRVWRRIRRQSF